MRLILIEVAVALVLAVGGAGAEEEAAAGQHPGLAVVEVFTSEGCSSCPGADALVNQLSRKARSEGLPVITVAYHVTIWDKLQTAHGAWKDRFGDEVWTQRHKAYSKLSPFPGRPPGALVTPQLYINGTTFAGGDLGATLRQALATEPPATVELVWNPAGDLAYRVTDAPDGAELQLILVEHGLSSEVTAGENHGKTLEHDSVARWATDIALDDGTDGTVAVALPEGVDRARCEVMAIVRGEKLSVKGGARIGPPPAADDRQSAVDDLVDPDLASGIGAEVCEIDPDGKPVCESDTAVP